MKKKEKLKFECLTNKRFMPLTESALVDIQISSDFRTKTYHVGEHTDDYSYGPRDSVYTEIRDGDRESGFPPSAPQF